MNLIDHFIRPSSMQANGLCAGKPRMEAAALPILLGVDAASIQLDASGNLPDPAGSSPQAEEGRTGHYASELILGMIYPDDGGDPKGLDDAMHTASAWLDSLSPWSAGCTIRYVSYVVRLVDLMRDDGWKIDAVMLEYALPGKGLGMTRGGKADVVIRAWHRAHGQRVTVVDLKLGYLDQPPAEEHLQLGCYAVMAWDKWQPDEVHVHMAQARLRDFSAASYDEKAIEETRQHVREIIAANRSEGAEVCPSIGACRYCRALVLCEAAHEAVLATSEAIPLFGLSIREHTKEVQTIGRRIAEEVLALRKAWKTGPGPGPETRLQIIETGEQARKAVRTITKALEES